MSWIKTDGSEMAQNDGNDGNEKRYDVLMDGRSQASSIRKRGQEGTLPMVLNSHHDLVEFTLPESPDGQSWQLMVDTIY